MSLYRTALSFLEPVLMFLHKNIKDALGVCAALFKIMIPIVIIIKLLQEAGLIVLISNAMSPLMHFFGLPGSMSLVWVTAMVTNLYGGAVVFITLLPTTPMTVSQVTVLATMMLIAHSLPVELGIARRCGARLRVQFIIRIGGAMLCGWILFHGYNLPGWGTTPLHPSWIPDAAASGWFAWLTGEIRNLMAIAIIVTAMIMLLDILKGLGLTDLMIRALSPGLRVMGVGREAGTIALVGLTLGLSYGGGLIIHESRSGRIPQGDIFFALTFMGLTHSLIEDTLLMVLLGAELFGVLWTRLAFTVLVLWILTKILAVVPERYIESLLVHPGTGKATTASPEKTPGKSD